MPSILLGGFLGGSAGRTPLGQPDPETRIGRAATPPGRPDPVRNQVYSESLLITSKNHLLCAEIYSIIDFIIDSILLSIELIKFSRVSAKILIRCVLFFQK